jgi:hypothetical protein
MKLREEYIRNGIVIRWIDGDSFKVLIDLRRFAFTGSTALNRGPKIR